MRDEQKKTTHVHNLQDSNVKCGLESKSTLPLHGGA